MEGGSDSEAKPVDPPPSDSSEELCKKRAHPDDDDEVKSEKRPRLDGEEKMEGEEGEEGKEESKEDGEKADKEHEAEAKVEASVKAEEVPSQPDSTAADAPADSQQKESLPEDVEGGEKDAVMEVDQSDVKEEKPETSEPSSSAKSEVKEEGAEVQEDKEEVVVSGSDAAADAAPRVKSERETIPNGGVAAERNGLDDRVTVKSDDSEKENQGRETPMDLTRKPAGVTDVITLSDESDEEDVRFTMPNGYQELSAEERMTRERVIKRLQAELRNEEAKLVLLKKLRHSQMTSPQLPDQSSANSLGKASHGSGSSHRQSGGPPPLVRGQQQQQVKMAPHFSQSQSMRSQHGSQSSRSQMHGPPPLVMAPRGSSNSSSSSHLLQQQQQQQQQHSQGSQRSNMLQHMYGGMQQPVQAHQPAAQVPPQDTQTPAQRQAAAKLALRKQLEKTLLQIPPPKPPPPEMNFIPSLACPDFILLLGLEEVVNYIIDAQLIAKGEKNADEKFVCNPFTCVQCHSDYTPVWKREKPGSKNVICEQCVTSNQKKALKQEHTNRLKSAFVKALQQEQEIERMQAQSLASTPPAPPAITSTPPLPNVAAAAASPMMPGGAAAAVQAQYKQQQSTAAEQLRQHQNFLQAHQAAQLQRVAGQQMGMSPFGPRGHYPYQLPYTKQSELQRQYLLDMIPRGSMPGWKS